MQVGDLVKCYDQVGVLIRSIEASPSFWIVLWSNGVRDTVNMHLLEVLNASR